MHRLSPSRVLLIVAIALTALFVVVFVSRAYFVHGNGGITVIDRP